MFKRLALIVFLIMAFTVSAFSEATPDTYDKNYPERLEPGNLYSESAYIIDYDTGSILFSKNSRVQMYPASTTKIMTLLLALESNIDLDKVVTIPSEASDIPKDSSLVPVFPGDKLTFRDLLYGTMLNSGNDGCNAIAVLISGTVDDFVDLMNVRASQLGCQGTHFANPHGYHDDNHYTTAQDLALMTCELLKHDLAREIVKTAKYTLTVERSGEQVSVPAVNTNYMVNENSEFYYAECIGVKTGFHNKAGRCMVGAVEKDGVTLITVSLNAGSDNEKFTDQLRLFNYGYTCYSSYTLEQMFLLAAPRIATVQISNASEKDENNGILDLNISLVSDPTYERLVESNNDTAMENAISDFCARSQLNITTSLSAPISAGEVLGTFKYTAQDGQEITASLIASRDVAKQPDTTSIYDVIPFLKIFKNRFVTMFVIVLILLLIVIYLYRQKKKRERERRRKALYERRRREMLRKKRLAVQNAKKEQNKQSTGDA